MFASKDSQIFCSQGPLWVKPNCMPDFMILARVSRSLKKGQGGIQKKGTWCALSHSKRALSVCARTLCVKDKRGISNIIWKSTSIFISTGRLTVED